MSLFHSFALPFSSCCYFTLSFALPLRLCLQATLFTWPLLLWPTAVASQLALPGLVGRRNGTFCWSGSASILGRPCAPELVQGLEGTILSDPGPSPQHPLHVC